MEIKKRYIKPESSIIEVRNEICGGSRIEVDKDEDGNNTSTGSGSILSNKYRGNGWDNIWSN